MYDLPFEHINVDPFTLSEMEDKNYLQDFVKAINRGYLDKLKQVEVDVLGPDPMSVDNSALWEKVSEQKKSIGRSYAQIQKLIRFAKLTEHPDAWLKEVVSSEENLEWSMELIDKFDFFPEITPTEEEVMQTALDPQGHPVPYRSRAELFQVRTVPQPNNPDLAVLTPNTIRQPNIAPLSLPNLAKLINAHLDGLELDTCRKLFDGFEINSVKFSDASVSDKVTIGEALKKKIETFLPEGTSFEELCFAEFESSAMPGKMNKLADSPLIDSIISQDASLDAAIGMQQRSQQVTPQRIIAQQNPENNAKLKPYPMSRERRFGKLPTGPDPAHMSSSKLANTAAKSQQNTQSNLGSPRLGNKDEVTRGPKR